MSTVGLALLHVMRPDLSPVSDRLSEYANGSYGAFMTVSFFTLGGGTIVLGLAIGLTGPTNGWSRLVPLAVIAGGCGLIVSGLYPTDPAGAPTTAERIHSAASGSASVALIGAAVASSLLSRPRPRRPVGAAGVLACLAVGLGAVSPVLHDTAWTGLGQRLLWLTLTVWLLVTAWQLRSQPTADAPIAARSAATQDRARGPSDDS